MSGFSLVLVAVLVVAALFMIMRRVVKIGCFLLVLALVYFLLVTFFGHNMHL